MMYCGDRTEIELEKSIHTSEEGGGRVINGFEEKQIPDEPCSEAYLRRVTGEEDLGNVGTLALTVDTNETQVILLVEHPLVRS